jgi:hypothetical protein
MVEQAIKHMRDAIKEMDEKLPNDEKGDGDALYRELRQIMQTLTYDLNELARRYKIT